MDCREGPGERKKKEMDEFRRRREGNGMVEVEKGVTD